MLWNKGDRGMSLRYDASAVAARELGIIIQPLGVSEPDDFIKAFDTMNRERPDAILMVSDSLTLRNRRRVFEYAAERRLPAIYETVWTRPARDFRAFGRPGRSHLQRH